MDQHTPGPWKYSRCKFGHPDNAKNPVVSSEVNNIARLFSQDSTMVGLTSKAPIFCEAEANARLIAASPNLLAACEKAAILYDHLSLSHLEAAAKYGPNYEPPSDADFLAVRAELNAAILKAKGGAA